MSTHIVFTIFGNRTMPTSLSLSLAVVLVFSLHYILSFSHKKSVDGQDVSNARKKLYLYFWILTFKCSYSPFQSPVGKLFGIRIILIQLYIFYSLNMDPIIMIIMTQKTIFLWSVATCCEKSFTPCNWHFVWMLLQQLLCIETKL